MDLEPADSLDEVTPEDFANWAKDNRGRQFWNELRRMRSDGQGKLQSAALNGNNIEAIRWASYNDTVDEVLQLTHLILQERETYTGSITEGTK